MGNRWLRIVLIWGVLAGLTIFFCQPAAAADFTLKAMSAWPKTVYETQYFLKYINMINENAAKNAPGKLEVKFAGGPEVMPNNEQVEALRKGLVDMVLTTVGYYTSAIPVVDGLAASTLTPEQERERGINDFMNKIHQEKVNAYYLGHLGTNIPFMLYLTKEISGADLKNMKIRCSPTHVNFLKSINAQPVVIPPPDVYTALERGVVDGVVWPAGLIRDWGWNEILKYYVTPTFYQGYCVVLINLDVWKKLPEDVQKVLLDTQKQGEQYVNALADEFVSKEMKELESKGMKKIALAGAEGDKFTNAAYDALWKIVIEKAPQEGPQLKEMLTKQTLSGGGGM